MRQLILAVVVFFGLSLGLPVRVVDAHGGDASLIHGCKNNFTGILRIVGPSDTCRANETAVDWNITGPAGPAFPTTCPPDSVLVGTACLDKYEASVWQTTDAGVIAKIKDGTVTLADLTGAGAFQVGAGSGDPSVYSFFGCPVTGNGCLNLYAVSIPGVTPSSGMNWFQAVAMARNAGKRLPTNGEWQAAALGTPDGAPCNVSSGVLGTTGTAGCVSDVGAFDMVGNLAELVDSGWLGQPTSCPGWDGFSDDFMCLPSPGTSPDFPGPVTLRRGGQYVSGTVAGPFAVTALQPYLGANDTGFRAAR